MVKTKLDFYYFPGKYRGSSHSTCNIRSIVPNRIPAVFHNGSILLCFIIKESDKKVKEHFECLRENSEKYENLSVPIKKKIRKVNKDGTRFFLRNTSLRNMRLKMPKS